MVLSNSFSVRIEVGMYLCMGHYLPDTCFSQNWARNICLDRKENNMYTHIYSNQGCHKYLAEKNLKRFCHRSLELEQG